MSMQPSELDAELFNLAAEIVSSEGNDPEYLTVAEMTWDKLVALGFDPSALSDDRLDILYRQVDKYCRELTHG